MNTTPPLLRHTYHYQDMSSYYNAHSNNQNHNHDLSNHQNHMMNQPQPTGLQGLANYPQHKSQPYQANLLLSNMQANASSDTSLLATGDNANYTPAQSLHGSLYSLTDPMQYSTPASTYPTDDPSNTNLSTENFRNLLARNPTAKSSIPGNQNSRNRAQGNWDSRDDTLERLGKTCQLLLESQKKLEDKNKAQEKELKATNNVFRILVEQLSQYKLQAQNDYDELLGRCDGVKSNVLFMEKQMREYREEQMKSRSLTDNTFDLMKGLRVTMIDQLDEFQTVLLDAEKRSLATMMSRISQDFETLKAKMEADLQASLPGFGDGTETGY